MGDGQYLLPSGTGGLVKGLPLEKENELSVLLKLL
jgi:hypothetical protein